MNSSGGFDMVRVAIFTFVPMLICAAFLRAKGFTGFLAIAGVIGIGIAVFLQLEGARLAVAAIAGLAALGVGGKLSDTLEHNRLKRIQDEVKRKQDALLKGKN